MYKLQKVVSAGAAGVGLAGAGGLIWFQSHSFQNSYLPRYCTVYAAELDKASVKDKYDALYAEPPPPTRTDSDRTPSTFEKKRTELEKAVARCREEFAPYKEAAKTYANNTVDFTVKATDATIEQVNYIKYKAPKEIQVATILGSGLVGLIVSYRRRGLLRKLFYTSAFSGIASYVIFPNETKSFMTTSGVFIKKYTLVAYNFVIGAQPKEK